MTPSWRKPVGALLILLLIAVWAGVIATQAGRITRLPGLVQAVIFLVLGLVWIAPLKPLLRWMELGRWR